MTATEGGGQAVTATDGGGQAVTAADGGGQAVTASVIIDLTPYNDAVPVFTVHALQHRLVRTLDRPHTFNTSPHARTYTCITPSTRPCACVCST